MFKKTTILFVFLSLVLTACFHAPAPTVSQKSPTTQTTKEEPLAISIEKMKAFMKKNPPESNTAVISPPEQILQGQSLKTGTFQRVNYMTSGQASLQKKGDSHFVVFEENFLTPDGPDLQIYLTKNSEPTQRNDISQGIHLGKLKITKGKQSYNLPPNVDLDQYHSISIHCKAFNVPWSYAKLEGS